MLRLSDVFENAAARSIPPAPPVIYGRVGTEMLNQKGTLELKKPQPFFIESPLFLVIDEVAIRCRLRGVNRIVQMFR